MYKYEFHAHCAECSKCASSPAVDMVRALHAAGYAGMVFTDHCCCGYSAVPTEWTWEKRVTHYYNAYLGAKEVGDALDFDVHFGWEHYVGRGKEILTYGIDLDFLLMHPDIPDMTVEEYCEAVRAYGGYTAQAHPYRRRPDIDELWHPFIHAVDGIEVYNAANGPCHNAKAMLLAVAHPELGRLSGADTHHTKDSVGRAGLIFSHRLRTAKELVDALKAGEGQLIVDGKPMETLDDFLTATPL
ncbi:MAG: hypothetical protein IJD01_06885 [Clostridia bacterium]|nr:hypothetical protein [Clostridia bacterium]